MGYPAVLVGRRRCPVFKCLPYLPFPPFDLVSTTLLKCVKENEALLETGQFSRLIDFINTFSGGPPFAPLPKTPGLLSALDFP